MILLDTNALLWLQRGHRRAAPLLRHAGRLCASPATLLELEFLVEIGQIRALPGTTPRSVLEDPRWAIDDPPSIGWFQAAAQISWTREPFDRLIAAHALFRGWKLATADGVLLDHLGPARTIEL